MGYRDDVESDADLKLSTADSRDNQWGIMRARQVSRSYILTFVLLVCIFVFWRQPYLGPSLTYTSLSTSTSAVNGTLGFENILVVSSGKGWRLEGLVDAAESTGLSFEVPTQPIWSTEAIDAFRGEGVRGKNASIGPGQAGCWLGHLNAMRHMLESKYTTALIMEDDVDWDVTIKSQLENIAPLIREVTNATDESKSWSPYGDEWDLLWVGNCGELPPRSKTSSFIDATLPDTPMYRQVYGDRTFHPPHLRMVYKSVSPVCTYAYALTASAALTIYEKSYGGRESIITADLRKWCWDGTLRCVSVVPELFHHHKKAGEVSSEIAVLEGWDDLAAPAAVGYTANIKYSARCNSRTSKLVMCQGEE